jgi:coenzyme F420 hydrogenase subunit beta
VVTALLLFALRSGRIDGAVVLGHNPDGGLRTQPYLATTEDQITASMGSKYCPGATNRSIAEVIGSTGRFALVGLPCQIHAVRMWEELDSALSDRLIYTLGLFCVNNNSYHGTDAFLRAHGIKRSEVLSIRYRDEGWPGKIAVETTRGRYVFARGTTETDPLKKQWLWSSFHLDYMIPRCMVCCDQTAELADVAFGDPHLPELRENESLGISWWIVRNENALKLISAARAAGVIACKPFSNEDALRAQNYSFKANVGQRMALWVMLHRSLPTYDREFDYRLPDAWKARGNVLSLTTHISAVRMIMPVVVRARQVLAPLVRRSRSTLQQSRRRVRGLLRRIAGFTGH